MMTGGSQEEQIRPHRYSVLSLVRGEHWLAITVTDPSGKSSKRSPRETVRNTSPASAGRPFHAVLPIGAP